MSALLVACAALLLGIVSLWMTITEIQSRAASEESIVLMTHNNNVKIMRMHMCIEQNINPCNIDDLTKPVDLSDFEKQQ